MKTLSPENCRDMMLTVCDYIIANEDLLNQIDGATGDADHGVGMARGFSAVKEVLSRLEPKDCGDVFRRTGMAMLSSMGGASGVIFSTLFISGAMGIGQADEMDGALLTLFLSRALDAVKTRGGAAPGSKTMVDALEPAVAAMLKTGNGLTDVLEAGAAAAAQGFEDTKNMVATLGRAKALGERTIGFGDAGAKSVEIILAAMCDFVKE